MKLPAVRFRLSEFKNIARWVMRNCPPPMAWLILGYLYGLETQYIEWKTTLTVDKAIKDWEAQCPDFIEDREVEIIETESEVEGLSNFEIKPK
jgi:hypothetical protein|tara:strand:+ start:3411 stop:3689 length:279 start_codon:yes stop_codon:yes gene_type:complete